MSEILVEKPIEIAEAIPKKPRVRKVKLEVPVAVAPVAPVAPVKAKKTKAKKELEIVIPETPAPAIEKKKRALSAYNLFVQKHIKTDAIKALPPKERFAKISEMYKAEKSKAV
jgi:hypothetical protein